MESTLYVFLPDGVFVPWDHRLDFTNMRIKSINESIALHPCGVNMIFAMISKIVTF